eukprot:6859864-Prorocentrum_lima.AAC.1
MVRDFQAQPKAKRTDQQCGLLRPARLSKTFTFLLTLVLRHKHCLTLPAMTTSGVLSVSSRTCASR